MIIKGWKERERVKEKEAEVTGQRKEDIGHGVKRGIGDRRGIVSRTEGKGGEKRGKGPQKERGRVKGREIRRKVKKRK